MLSTGLRCLRSPIVATRRSAAAVRIHNFATATAGGVNTGVVKVSDKEVTQVDYYAGASHYDTLWCTVNMGFGYYPPLALSSGTGSNVVLDYPNATLNLCERMMNMAGIKSTDKVLDLGAGRGVSCLAIAKATGAHCVGVDITPENIEQAKHHAKAHPDLNVEYFVGSFTDLSEEIIANGPYDVVFSAVSFCHVHEHLADCFAQIKKVLKPGTGRAIINDYIGCDREVSANTIENVYKRLHFSKLHGGAMWRKIADESGLTIMQYEDLSAHMSFGYSQLAAGARKHGFKSTDGTPLADNYEVSSAAAAKREIGLNTALMQLK
jgi:ubiquinone/menaquinone biosynthesis C-methylase UbiE